ncbi:MAG: hypothetical protein V2I33_05575, partial [Kangiellaceae bacterium]|nr:hypothetical protein [Kangiellaceae bacterium]
MKYRASILALAALTLIGCDLTFDQGPSERRLTVVPKAECASNLLVADECAECKGVKGCVCAAQGDTITWYIKGEKGFKIAFIDANPFDKRCSLGSTDLTLSCTIPADAKLGIYDYDVILAGCKTGTDPRIV